MQLGPHHPLLRSLQRTSFTVCFANHPHNLARLLTMPNHAFPALLFFSGKFGGCGSITGTIRGVLKVLSLGVILPYEAPTFKTAVHANTSGELFMRASSSKALPESTPFYLSMMLPSCRAPHTPRTLRSPSLFRLQGECSPFYRRPGPASRRRIPRPQVPS